MMEQAGMSKWSVCVLAMALAMALSLRADENEAADVNAGGGEPAVPETTAEQPARLFEPLVRVTQVRGICEVLNPDVGRYEPVVPNRAYPLGSSLRTGPGSSAQLVFSDQETVHVEEQTELTFAAPRQNPATRVVRLIAGRIRTSLRDNLDDGLFIVLTPNAKSVIMGGRGDYRLTTDDALETFQAATITGLARIDGPNYHIPTLRAANTVNIQTTPNRALSRLISVSGDFPILLENGTDTPVNFGMSPKAVVKIWREIAPVGGRQVVSTLVVSPTGKARHRFAYADGRASLATGELVTAQEGEEGADLETAGALPVLLTVDAAQQAKPDADEMKPESPQEPALPLAF